MKLAFNCLNSGIGNNGGSRTVILCSKVLESLGHRCDILSTTDSFTWFDHKSVISYIPNDLDVIIATACTTVPSTLNSSIKNKAYYIRGHETWVWDETKLAACYNAGLFNITNSYGLQRKLKEFDADSVVVYQGIDIEEWENKQLRLSNKIRIGCLYQKKPTKRWEDFIKLANILGSEKYEYVAFGDSLKKEPFLFSFVYCPSHEQLVDLYSSCHIWFAPTELEGLHNVPMEASLCGCLVVCSDAPMNGMINDYAFAGNMATAMIYKVGDIDAASCLIRNPNYGIIPRMQCYIKDFIGSRETNMKKFIDILGTI